jgi:uncharacterized protein
MPRKPPERRPTRSQGETRSRRLRKVELGKIQDLPSGDLRTKADRLLEIIASHEDVLVAFSGGVDSSVLLAAAVEGAPGRVLAVTASSPIHPGFELSIAKEIAAALGCEHRVIKTSEMNQPIFTANPTDRCYHCKKALFQELKNLAAAEGLRAVLDGSTVTDLSDFRPGEKALGELGIISPLRQADFTKPEVRDLGKAVGLPVWDRPQAACLASRFPYGTEITREALGKVERMEDLLRDLGFRQVRARYHGDLLRIEVEKPDIEKAAEPATRDAIVQAARREGFKFIALDLMGFRSGVFNP